jgi:hypothetical protein
MNIYLVKRGPKPDWHKAPHSPVLICTRRDVAMWEAGWSGDQAQVWAQNGSPACGFLLIRWNGLDIDYGHVVRTFKLPDGTSAAFHHRHRHPETWVLLNGAVWWSERKMPAWLAEAGAVYPSHAWTQGRILQVINNCRQDAAGRNGEWHFVERPEFWPVAVDVARP